jgi:hypothetical protein
MDRGRPRRIAFRAAVAIGLVLALAVLLLVAEHWRTQAEIGAVLSGLLSEELSQDLANVASEHEVQIVLQRETETPWGKRTWRHRPVVDPLSWFGQSSRISRASFLLSNVLSTNVETPLRLPGAAQSFFVSREELRHMKPGDFQARFPNNLGYFVVSNVGLDLNKREAILYIDHFCSGLCGGGGYVLMRKVDGVWHIVDQHETWVS